MAHEAALLLEGAWPAGAPAWHESLDQRVDAGFEWIDVLAGHWAEQLGGANDLAAGRSGGGIHDEITAAYLNALSLRYGLVRLLRVVAYLTEIRPVESGERMDLVAARGRDEDYADLLAELARAAGAELCVHWRVARGRPETAFPPNGRPRRWCGLAARWLEPSVGDCDVGHRAVLCGNPRILDPVCAELVGRGCRVWWLYDRFAFHSWLRWRKAGVGQLVCNASTGRQNRIASRLPEQLLCRQVDLVPAVGRWLAGQMRLHGRMQTRTLEALDAHFRRIRPDSLVVCEDATPFARAAVAIARRHGATSFVVQHGAPTCRFAYAPLAADRFLAWGHSSRQQLIDWGVAAERIEVTGSPQHDNWAKRFQGDVNRVEAARGSLPAALAPWRRLGRRRWGRLGRGRARPAWKDAALRFEDESVKRAAPRLLVLGTVPPDDDRPESIAAHFNRATYTAMWQAIFAVAQARPGTRLTIKTHPRGPRDAILEAAMQAHPAVPSTIVKNGLLWELVAGADCTLSLISSAGVEAAQAGAPVIQIMPPGSGDILPCAAWGLVGSARTQAELERLVDRVLRGDWRAADPTDGRVLDNFSGSAAARAADAILRADHRAVPADGRAASAEAGDRAERAAGRLQTTQVG
ncbi:MAG: hypothetical protein JW809_12740 [Pirellulales bacterium]|nr:hypothetical protein [Pirellulales bacterium]